LGYAHKSQALALAQTFRLPSFKEKACYANERQNYNLFIVSKAYPPSFMRATINNSIF
jgi:hypothetical protein